MALFKEQDIASGKFAKDMDEEKMLLDEASKLSPEEIDSLDPEAKDELNKLMNKEDVVKQAKAGIRGVAQGATLGFADEAIAGAKAAFNFAKDQVSLDNLEDTSINIIDEYDKQVKIERDANQQAQIDNPNTYMAGELVGNIATSALPIGAATGVGKAALSGATISGINATGRADNLSTDDLKEIAKEAAIGGALGGTISGAGKLIQKMGPDVSSTWRKLLGVNTTSKSNKLDVYLSRTGQNQEEFFTKMVNHKVGNEPLVKAFDSLDDIANKSKIALNEADVVKNSLLDKANVMVTEEEARSMFTNIRSKIGEQLDGAVVPETRKNLFKAIEQINGAEENFVSQKVARSIANKSEVPVSFNLKDLYGVKQQLQQAAYSKETLNDVSRNALKSATGEFNSVIDNFITQKSLAGKLPEGLAEQFKNARITESNLIKFSQAAEDVALATKHKSFSPYSELFKASALGGAASYMGATPAVAVGMAATLKGLSKLPGADSTVAVMMTKLAGVIQNDTTKGAKILQTLASAANNSVETFSKATKSEFAKTLLGENPIERTSIDVINKKTSILNVAEYIDSDQAEQLKEAFDSGDDETIGMIMDNLSKNPAMKPYFKGGIGFNGKVYNKEDKNNLLKELESMNIDHVQRLKLKKELINNNTVPVGQSTPTPAKEFIKRKGNNY